MSSETLREQKGRDEKHRQRDREDQTDEILDAHSRSTALTTKARTTNEAIVTRTNSRSDTGDFLLIGQQRQTSRGRRRSGHPVAGKRETAAFAQPAPNGPHR